MKRQTTPAIIPPKRICRLLITIIFIAFTSFAHAAGKASHVLIVVMDGLRPDSVTDADMPTLAALGKGGTFFANHHPVYLSSTEVNGSALATGMSPAHSGVMANREYRPDLELLGPVDTQGEWAAWKGDQILNNAWLRSPTLPELARAAGLKTAVAGTKGVALLWDRGWKNRTADQPTLYEGRTIPSAVLDKIVPELGPIPPGVDARYFANRNQDNWTVRALTEKLWADGVPSLSVLWLSEPDFAQHGSGPGSKVGKAAVKSSDDCLAAVLMALEQKKVRDKTDILVVSDHGFSTISRKVDVMDELWKRDFEIGGAYLRAPDKGNIVMVGLGGSASFYVVGHERAAEEKLVTYLQTTDWAGVIFTRDGLEGTFKLSDAGIDTPDAPDVVVSMRWDDRLVQGGLPGTIVYEGTSLKRGQGTHGSLSRFDMHNTLIAAGPDFKAGFVNNLPSANSDVAPTVAQILGLDLKFAMDGRVLAESLVDGKAPELAPQTTTLEAKRTIDRKTWSQYLRVTKLGNRSYYDEGNAGAPPQ
jgi:arylsulfatase A-like enzyme